MALFRGVIYGAVHSMILWTLLLTAGFYLFS